MKTVKAGIIVAVGSWLLIATLSGCGGSGGTTTAVAGTNSLVGTWSLVSMTLNGVVETVASGAIPAGSFIFSSNWTYTATGEFSDHVHLNWQVLSIF